MRGQEGHPLLQQMLILDLPLIIHEFLDNQIFLLNPVQKIKGEVGVGEVVHQDRGIREEDGNELGKLARH